MSEIKHFPLSNVLRFILGDYNVTSWGTSVTGLRNQETWWFYVDQRSTP